jgi:nucleotide-binding universal stress UspA family protein
MTNSDTLYVLGYPISSVNIPLKVGWNLLGWYHSYDTTASSLSENIIGCTSVSRWNASIQTYDTYIVGGPPSFDFTIRQGMGLFVDVTVEFMLRAQDVYESLIAKAKEFTDVIKKKALLAGIEADSIVRDGEVYKVIIDVAKEYQADMIVMGSLGRTGIKRLLMGSTAERVLGIAFYPVLIVKP